MIFHILRVAYEDDLTEDERREVDRKVRSLAELACVEGSEVCQDLGNPIEGFTHSCIITFKGPEEYLEYITDAYHGEVVEYVVPRFKKMMFCDAAEGYDPELYGRIQAAIAAMPMSPETRRRNDLAVERGAVN